MKLFLSFFLLLSWITVSIQQQDGKRLVAHSDPYSSEEARLRHRRRRPRPTTRRPWWPPRGPRPGPRPPIQYDPTPRTCASDWMTFNRPQGTWCVKVFYGPANQNQAEQGCKNMGTTLSGVQTRDEARRIADAARVVVNQHGGGIGEVWLGARRKNMCPYKESCQPLETFEWTDGHTTGKDGFNFAYNEPNGWILPAGGDNRPWGQQYCLAAEVHPNCDSCPVVFGFFHNQMDDKHCQDTFRTYACGKKP
ncbi:unnamed protein product [Caenorhabditis brenneri]